MNVKKPVLVIAAVLAAVAAAARRKQGHADIDVLWREATADASR